MSWIDYWKRAPFPQPAMHVEPPSDQRLRQLMREEIDRRECVLRQWEPGKGWRNPDLEQLRLTCLQMAIEAKAEDPLDLAKKYYSFLSGAA